MKRTILLVVVLLVSNILIAQDYPLAIIYTPKHTLVSDTYDFSSMSIPSYTSSEIEYFEDCLYNLYSGAQLLATPNPRYNCHAYAWYMEGNANATPVWLGRHTNYAEDAYWNDGSYLEVSENYATTVSYHEMGNHSAIRDNNGWYRSKWGSGLLVKHLPNAVPNGTVNVLNPNGTNYYPTNTKKFYRRAVIAGSTIPCGQSVYEFVGLISNYNVVWSFQDTNSSANGLLTQNSPSTNKCTIDNSGYTHINEVLVAKVYRAGTLVQTYTKQINTGAGQSVNMTGTFNGIYQPNYPFPDISQNNIVDGNTIIVTGGYLLTLTSSDFGLQNVTYTGTAVQSWTKSGNTVTIQLKNTSSPSNIVISARSGCHYFQFTIQVYPNILQLLTESNVNISSSDKLLNVYLEFCDLENSYYKSLDYSKLVWDMTIINAQTGKKVYAGHVRGISPSIDTNGWESGIYIVQINMGEHSVSKKVMIKK